jgi:hypothetical protein
MFPLFVRKPFPRPSLALFVALQMLDILTTMIGLRLGAHEGSMFIGQLMRVGPVAALLITKIMAVFLAALAMRFKRPRIIVILNVWFFLLVGWNLVIIVLSGLAANG